MSKSKKNVIAPEAIIDVYGADTIRWFMLSDTPPERDIEWTEDGAEGCWRFVQRIYRLVDGSGEFAAAGRATATSSKAQLSNCAAPRIAPSRRSRKIWKPCASIARSRSIYELANAIGAADTDDPAPVRREALEALVLLIGPMMPHLAETCWEALGHKTLVVDTAWPKADPGADACRYGHHRRAGERQAARRRLQFARGADKRSRSKAHALALDGVARALDGKAPKRVIVVPERIVNIVA